MKQDLVFSGLSDEELVNLIKQNNQRAFVYLYDKYWAEMYACAFHIFPNRETCEDLIHDVFLSIWTSRQKLKIRSIKDYLYISVKNKSLNKIRSQRNYSEITEETYDTLAGNELTDEQLNLKEINIAFEKGISTLPNKCKEILELSRKSHLSNKEIANRLNINVKTVENHINNALRKIKLTMGDFLATVSLFIFYFFGG